MLSVAVAGHRVPGGTQSCALSDWKAEKQLLLRSFNSIAAGNGSLQVPLQARTYLGHAVISVSQAVLDAAVRGSRSGSWTEFSRHSALRLLSAVLWDPLPLLARALSCCSTWISFSVPFCTVQGLAYGSQLAGENEYIAITVLFTVALRICYRKYFTRLLAAGK